MKYIRRFIHSFKIGLWAYRNPKTMNAINFKMLSDLLELIFKVAQEGKPIMTKIGYIHPDTNEPCDIVAIWAGSGIGADPYKRISELKAEIETLKAHLLANTIENRQKCG